MRVVVIGAGAAGLSAAHELRQRGIDFLVLEAADHAGGRIAAQDVDGFRIDTGAQVFTDSYDTAKRLCRDLGVPVEACSRRAGAYSRGEFRILDQLDPLASLRTVLSFKLLSPGGLWQMLRLARKLRAHADQLSFADPSRALALDTDSNVADWIRAHAGPEFLEELGQAGISLLTLAEPEEVGAAYGMALLWGFVFQPVEFVAPVRGIGSLTQALVAAVSERIRLASPVLRVVVRDGAVTGVQTSREFVPADAVICATTATAARRLLPDLPAELARALARVTYSSVCRTVFGVDGPTLPDRCYSVMFPRKEGVVSRRLQRRGRQVSRGGAPRHRADSRGVDQPPGGIFLGPVGRGHPDALSRRDSPLHAGHAGAAVRAGVPLAGSGVPDARWHSEGA